MLDVPLLSRALPECYNKEENRALNSRRLFGKTASPDAVMNVGQTTVLTG